MVKKRKLAKATNSSPTALLSRFPEIKGVYVSSTQVWIEHGMVEWDHMVEVLYKLPLSERILGIDVEWFCKGPTALLQIASSTHCFVFHLTNMLQQRVPQEVVCVLNDPSVIKCGNGVTEDAKRLSSEQGIITKSLMDLGGFAFMYNMVPAHTTNLKALGTLILNLTIEKSKYIVRANWELPLTQSMFDYATDDALISLFVGQAITRHAKNMKYIEEDVERWLKRMSLIAPIYLKQALNLHMKKSGELERAKAKMNRQKNAAVSEKSKKLPDGEKKSKPVADKKALDDGCSEKITPSPLVA